MAHLLPNVRQQFLNANGAPLAGGQLYSYIAGTNTLQATFTDATAGTPNANPTILDANGEANVWINTNAYKFILQDVNNVVQWTVDGVTWIGTGEVTTAMIVAGAITSPLLATGAVTSGAIAAGAVGAMALATGAVTTIKIAAGAVGTTQLADSAVTNVKAGYGLVPPGAILPYGGASAPTGFLLCDGSSYVQATYPALYTAIGNAYGTVDAAHFNVPDCRGLFPRGVTGASGNDPDSTTRTAMATGGNTGNNVGSIQADNIAAHSHSLFLATAGSNGSLAQGTNTGAATSTNTNSAGGAETRPKNFYVNYIIKT